MKPKPGFGIGNQNFSASVSEPKFFFLTPKLGGIEVSISLKINPDLQKSSKNISNLVLHSFAEMRFLYPIWYRPILVSLKDKNSGVSSQLVAGL